MTKANSKVALPFSSASRVEKDAADGRGLAGVDVSDEHDVHVRLFCHV
jgi:hypothetical protein